MTLFDLMIVGFIIYAIICLLIESYEAICELVKDLKRGL